ncbi:type IV secretion system protein VirB10 (plasmid) [Methylobacterium sp. NMS12]
MIDQHDAKSSEGLDRAITPVAGASTARPGSGRKVGGTIALVALCGGLLWASWKRAPSEAEARTTPTISVGSSFERLREPPSEPAQTAALPVTSPPPPQPQRVERPQTDELLESSRRAPVLVYNRPPQSRPGTPAGYAADPTGPLPYGPGYGQPEPRNELSDKLRPTPIEGVRAARLPNRNLLVAQGTAIPCVLETAMSSDVAGFVSCVINRDVMSDNGHVVLMEKGTQVVGEYRGNVRRGSSRMFVLWSRAKTPTGVIVNLASPATDALGRAGFDGEIDSHFIERFGGALLLSIVGDAGQIAGRQLSEGGLQINTAQSGSQSAAAIATENSINIPPTLNKNQGELVSIFVARDLDFSSVYSLRVTAGRTDLLDQAAGLRPRGPVFKP